jgi:hypothetical protein
LSAAGSCASADKVNSERQHIDIVICFILSNCSAERGGIDETQLPILMALLFTEIPENNY